MFKPLNLPAQEQPRAIEITVDGRPVPARAGEPLAAALLNAGVVRFRHTPVSGEPRAPLCMMGVCFDCLVEVDGVQNVQACMTEVQADMQVRLPDGARRPGEAP